MGKMVNEMIVGGETLAIISAAELVMRKFGLFCMECNEHCQCMRFVCNKVVANRAGELACGKQAILLQLECCLIC